MLDSFDVALNDNALQQCRFDPPAIDRVAVAKGELHIHRLDRSFAVASGNKAFKLAGHFVAAQRAKKRHLLSFGGAWSNHLHALAVFAAKHHFSVTAIVRGLHVDVDNPMLAQVQALGGRVVRVSKQEYARRREADYLQHLTSQYPDAWLIPEGADDAFGRWGMRYLASVLAQSIQAGDTLVVASGTGATVRGLAMGLADHCRLVSALVVKDMALAEKIRKLCSSSSPDFRLIDASGDGYGRVSSEQLSAIQSLYTQTGVLLDPLYNGKAFSRALILAEQGERVHLLHTGGVQGWRGFESRGLLKQFPVLSELAQGLTFDSVTRHH